MTPPLGGECKAVHCIPGGWPVGRTLATCTCAGATGLGLLDRQSLIPLCTSIASSLSSEKPTECACVASAIQSRVIMQSA